MSRPRSAPACSTAIRMSFSISLGRRISLLLQVRVASVELVHLAEGAPTVVAVPRASEIGVAGRFDAARQLVPRRQLMGQALVLDEAVLTRQVDSLLVQTHGIGVSIFEARDLGRYQLVLVGESRWIVFGPLA